MRFFQPESDSMKIKWVLLLTIVILALPSLACGGGGDDNEAALSATNTALELKALQLQATIDAGERAQEDTSTPEPQGTSNSPDVPLDDDPDNEMPEFPTPTIQPTPDNVLFFDDFSNPSNGWDLSARNTGGVGFIRQRLALSPDDGKCVMVSIPNLNVEEEYYIEADVMVTQYRMAALGYIVGSDPTQYFKYGIGAYNSGNAPYRVQTFSPNDELYNPSTETSVSDPLWEEGEPFTLGMELLNGVYTLYLNGQILASNQFSPSGSNIGVFACTTLHETNVHFDNLVIRESR